MKKIIKWKIGLMFLILLFIPTFIFAASNTTSLDAVLVIDSSGSMEETDPNKLGLEGVKLFVDMLGMTDNKVGVVTYGHEVDQVYPMTTVSQQSDKEKVKQFVDGLTRDLDYTDISKGLGEAINLLNGRGHSNGSPLVIIFTDGNNAIGGVKGRTYDDIDNEVKNIISEASSKGYPIYTIGLNDNGKLNEAYLENIAVGTGGKAFVTKDPNELPNILKEIFAAHTHQKVQSLGQHIGTGDFQEIPINIPNSNVLEANISATSNQPVTFKLEDPQGVERAIPDADITLHTSTNYSLLKLMRPIMGDWKLFVKGAAGDKINVDLVYNYDIEVLMDPLSQTSYGVGDSIEVTARLGLQGNPIDDPALYSSSQAAIVIKDLSTDIETKIKMQESNQSFTGSYTLKEQGDFQVWVSVEETSFIRESAPISFSVGKASALNHTSKPSNEGVNEEAASVPIWIYVLIVVVALALIIVAFICSNKLKLARKPLIGQLVLEVRDNNTGKLSTPQYKKLHVFEGKVNLHTLLQFAPELSETEKIILKVGQGDDMYLINETPYNLERGGRVVKADGGLLLKAGDHLSINLADSHVTIQLEYLL